jgi:TolB-like protein
MMKWEHYTQENCMKKLFALFLLIVLGINCYAQEASPVSLNVAIRSAMTYLTGRIAPNSKVVVLNFSAPTEELSNYIIEDLSDYIVNSRTLTVVDRRSLEVIRSELYFNMSGEVSDATAQRIGQLLGAQSIISGSISPLGSNYRFRVQAIEVETAALQGGQNFIVVEDETLAALLGNSYTPHRQSRSTALSTNQKFAVGVQVGTLFGLSSGRDGGSGTGDFGFIGSLYGAYAFNSIFRLQLGMNIMMNNLNAENNGYENYKYTSLDIPLLANLYLNTSSGFLFRVGVGPYLSLPLGDLETSHYGGYTYYIEEPVNFGFLGDLGVGYRIGSGNLIFDLRYLMDFQTTVFVNRGGVTAVVGYEYWF